MGRYLKEFVKGMQHVIAIDPSLKPILEQNQFQAFETSNELPPSFQYLVRSILSQQVSGHAANAILNRFLGLFKPPDKFPTPEQVLTKSVEELRAAGLSLRKSEYVHGLAESYVRGDLNDEIFNSLDNDEVADRIVAVRGLGPWTAQMFMLFWLHRLDIFSPADIGVQRGFRRYVREHSPPDHTSVTELTNSPGKSKKATARTALPSDIKQMEHVADCFRPYRSVFQLVLWKLASINMKAIDPAETAVTGVSREKAPAVLVEGQAPVPDTTKSPKQDNHEPEMPLEPQAPSPKRRRRLRGQM